MLLKLIFLMVLIVTLQIDLNYSYRYWKFFNINPKSSSKVKGTLMQIWKSPYMFAFK